MSQHVNSLKNADGESFQVMVGWDRPLQGFFLVVTTHDRVGFETIYSNLEEKVSHPNDFSFFEEKLTALKMVLPKDMREALEEDKRVNRGNHFVDWEKVR